MTNPAATTDDAGRNFIELWTESIAQALSLVPEEAREGMQAFLDHRKIDF